MDCFGAVRLGRDRQEGTGRQRTGVDGVGSLSNGRNGKLGSAMYRRAAAGSEWQEGNGPKWIGSERNGRMGVEWNGRNGWERQDCRGSERNGWEGRGSITRCKPIWS